MCSICWTLIKISFFLFSACTEEALSTTNIITFLPYLPPYDNEKVSGVSNPLPYPAKEYFSGSAFFVNLTMPNKELNNENLLSRLSGHKFVS